MNISFDSIIYILSSLLIALFATVMIIIGTVSLNETYLRLSLYVLTLPIILMSILSFRLAILKQKEDYKK